MARGLGFRIPRLTGIIPKKRLIPYIDNTTLVVGGGLVTVAGLYYAHTQRWINIPFLGEVVGPGQFEGGTPTGNKISFTVSPNVVEPDSQILISGNVTDSNGVPAKPTALYYYIYQDFSGEQQGQGLTKLIASGNVGSLISEYRVSVSTAGFRPGDYIVAVADEQLPATGGVVAGSTDIAGQAPPLTSNTVSPNEFGNITLS